jgi:hypothetical protein
MFRVKRATTHTYSVSSYGGIDSDSDDDDDDVVNVNRTISSPIIGGPF